MEEAKTEVLVMQAVNLEMMKWKNATKKGSARDKYKNFQVQIFGSISRC